jgi:hypothetical protein
MESIQTTFLSYYVNANVLISIKIDTCHVCCVRVCISYVSDIVFFYNFVLGYYKAKVTINILRDYNL